jgi:hypothetical protein
MARDTHDRPHDATGVLLQSHHRVRIALPMQLQYVEIDVVGTRDQFIKRL